MLQAIKFGGNFNNILYKHSAAERNLFEDMVVMPALKYALADIANKYKVKVTLERNENFVDIYKPNVSFFRTSSTSPFRRADVTISPMDANQSEDVEKADEEFRRFLMDEYICNNPSLKSSLT